MDQEDKKHGCGAMCILAAQISMGQNGRNGNIDVSRLFHLLEDNRYV